jgi:Ca-activated chloride channel family protein
MRGRACLSLATLAVCLLLLVPPVWADGVIIVDPPVPEEPPYLTIRYHRVTVTIEDQVATTHVDQVFVNEGNFELEGVYVFPLPEEAAIDDFAMWVDGERLSGEMLPADEARQIYEDIVRRQRDPALLEYVGRNTFRARVFPIPPRSEKRVEIEYREVLPMENGVVHYRYPLDTERFSPRPIEDVSVRVEIHSREAIKAVYSSSHEVDVDRPDDYRAVVGYEAYDVRPDLDFSLYYTVDERKVGLNLLSFKPRGEEGTFLMLLAPRVEVKEEKVLAKDVILVLDTSGSMRGEKIAQAKKALSFVLDHLNAEDRFNVVAFSTGVHTLAASLQDVDAREEAARWVDELQAKGGTHIHRALLEALAQVEGERPAIVVFITDGLATEGVVDTEQILADVEQAAPENARLFTFGVGDDVNTLLLDRLARDQRGASAYVRPGEAIDERIAAFYAKVSMPLLSDLRVEFAGAGGSADPQVEDLYPYPLPDLFAGTQVVVAGRYRQGGDVRVTLRGTLNGEEQVFEFGDAHLSEDGGEAFIPRLWAMRKVGYLLNQIRLHGESPELVQEIVDLAVRYGIMTPYTSFLVQEDSQVFSEKGRQEMAEREFSNIAGAPQAAPSGKAAVDEAQEQGALEGADTASGATGGAVQVVRDKVFLLREGVWTDTTYDAERMVPLRVGWLSDDYFRLIAAYPEWGAYFGIGERVLAVLPGADGQPAAYLVVGEGQGNEIDVPLVATPASVRATPAPATATPAPAAPTPGRLGGGICSAAPLAVLLALLAALRLAQR